MKNNNNIMNSVIFLIMTVLLRIIFLVNDTKMTNDTWKQYQECHSTQIF